MKINAQLDVDVLALQRDEQVTCLLTLDAPVPAAADDRPGESLIVVVDRSGSMEGDRLEAVRSSLHALVDRVKPQDTLGVVTFDNHAEVAVPARPMRDHHVPTVHALIEQIETGGMTNLSGGYLLGLSEARRHLGATGATVVLLSDGHANEGITEPSQVGALAGQGRADRVTTATIGIGDGYDELLLAEISRHGNGAHRFAYTPDDAAEVVAEEAGDLLSKSAVNAFVRVKPVDPALVERITVMQDLPTWLESDPDGEKVVVVALGDLFAGEHRELLLGFDVPGIDELGLRQLATLTIEYVALPTLEANTVSWPVAINVLPGDEAAGRVPNPTVTVARLLAQVNEVKRQASDASNSGDGEGAARLLEAQAEIVEAALSGVDDSTPTGAKLRQRLAAERDQARKLARGARDLPQAMAVKSMMEDSAMWAQGRNNDPRSERNRGRRDF